MWNGGGKKMLHQFAVRSCFPCVNCFSDENNTLSPTPLHPADPPSLVEGGGGNKSAPEDKTTPNEPLIALLALLLVQYTTGQRISALPRHFLHGQ